MQLKKRKKKGQLWQSLGIVTANLFMATHGIAQSVSTQQPNDSSGNFINEASSELGTTALDTAILIYREGGGRVQAIEPVANLKITRENGDIFSARFVYDSLTGASPNGAAPWSGSQVFTTPTTPPGTDVAVTSASGHRTIVTIPGTGTQVAQYTVAPHELPVDAGFKDQRYALDLGYALSWDTGTVTSLGISGSEELDYRSFSVNGTVSQAFNDKNTTLSLGANFEYDKSKPLFGVPTPFTEMNGLDKGSGDSKTVTSLNAGITQVMSRFWLLQLNYDIGWNKGYQNDPYKVVSVVDTVTGMPLKYLYENRPNSRVRQSIYLGNKIAIGPTVTDLDFRYYHDSWGINSITGDASIEIPLWRSFYIQPEYHYYRQSAANFFKYYLLDGESPDYASADGRLAKFNARTYGVKLGYGFSRNSELYVMAEDYKQSGNSHIAGAPGDLANENFFSGVHAKSLMVGFNFKF
jgi:hypothetical protein